MDELLALFDEEEQNQQEEHPEREQQNERTSKTTGSSNNENRKNAAASASTSTSNRRQEQTTPKQQQQQHQQQMSRDQQLSALVDNKVGIRMINRKISSTELFDMISESEYSYQSPAALSAMSLEGLNRILVSPAAVVLDPATVCGRTRVLTVGLVFSNSGTRLSQAGNGFCALTVGSNLASGPAITVLLFGSAYNRFVKIAKPGKVIVLMNPRLVPPKQQSTTTTTTRWQKSSSSSTLLLSATRNNDMAQTFSVNDEQQVRLVADARDFAFCKATVAARNDTGKWVPNAKRCTKHVDLRMGEYCHTHRKQALVKDGSNKRDGNKGGLAQLRIEARRTFPNTTRNTFLPQSGTATQQLSPVPSLMATQHELLSKNREISQLSVSSRTTLGTSLRTFSTITRQVPTKNSILNPYNNAKPKATLLQRPSAITVTPKTPRDEATKTTTTTTTITTKRVTNDWLQEATASKKVAARTTKPRRRTTINTTDSAQFDGSVAIPKPLPMLAINAVAAATTKAEAAAVRGRLEMPQTVARAAAAAQNKTATHKSSLAAVQHILWQQKQVAAQLKDPTRLPPAQSPGSTKNATAKLSNTTNREDLLYGSLGVIDRDEILHAKSRFAQEIDAQEYARARQSVSELEFAEARKDDASHKKKKNNTSSTGAIQKEWHCVNCRRSYSIKPNRCYALNHTVKIRRSIEQSKSITEKRQELSEKDAKDGGLRLGQGLEWSRWNSRF